MPEDKVTPETDEVQSGGSTDNVTDENTVEYWRAKAQEQKDFARQWENRSKANFTELEALKAAKDSKKTDVEKLSERLQALETENASLKISSLKAKAAAKYNIPEALMSRVSGTTEEEIDADAKLFSESMGSVTKKPAPGVKPDKNQGPAGAGTSGKAKLSRAEFAAMLKSKQSQN